MFDDRFTSQDDEAPTPLFGLETLMQRFAANTRLRVDHVVEAAGMLLVFLTHLPTESRSRVEFYQADGGFQLSAVHVL